MKFMCILSRLTGISTPIFGISWDPPETEIETAKRVLTFLEDRRVLYEPSELEVPSHCVASVLEIRRLLTGELAKLQGPNDLADSLRAMRAACRKFIGVSQRLDGVYGWDPHGYNPGHFATWQFDSALGEMRGVFGVHIAQLAARYGLDIEDQLAAILPTEDADA